MGDGSEVLARKYFPGIDYDSLKFEDQIRLRFDALWLEAREMKNLAELVSKLFGG